MGLTGLLLLKECFPVIFPTALQAVILLGIILSNRKISDGKPIIWYSIFVIYCFFELISYDKINILMTMVNTLLYIIAYNNLCKNKEDIIMVFKSFVLIGLFFFMYILYTFRGILGYGRLGDHLVGTSFESSIVFSYYIIIVICSCIAILILFFEKRDMFKYIAIVTLVAGSVLAVFNGAKKGFLMPLFFVIIYIIISQKRNIIKLVLYSAMFMFVIYLLWDSIKNIDVLQRYFVERVEGMVAVFLGDSTVGDTSTEDRLSYIPIAFECFLDNPVFGMGGLAHSNLYFKSVIRVNHPHNSFLEMLAAGGLVMFFLYFYFPFKVLKHYLYCMHYSKIHLLLFCMIVTILFNNLNSSSYNIPVLNIYFVVAYRYSLIFNNSCFRKIV